MLMLVLFSLLMKPGNSSVNAVTYHLISAAEFHHFYRSFTPNNSQQSFWVVLLLMQSNL